MIMILIAGFQLRDTQRASMVVSTSPKGCLDRFQPRNLDHVAGGQVHHPDRAPRPPDKHGKELAVLSAH